MGITEHGVFGWETNRLCGISFDNSGYNGHSFGNMGMNRQTFY